MIESSTDGNVGWICVVQVVDRYTQLTGRPRMPQKSQFGLNLSDKLHPNNNGEPWWKKMITEHRAAGYAFDHQVNDNAWRASNKKSYETEAAIPAAGDGTIWDATKKLLIVHVGSRPVTDTVWIANSASAQNPGDGGGADGGPGASGGAETSNGGAAGSASSSGSVTTGGRGGNASSTGTGTGGASGAGGAAGKASSGGGSGGAASGSGGAASGSQASSKSASSSAGTAENKSSGCSCAVGSNGRGFSALPFVLFLLATWLRRRRATPRK